MRFSVTRWFLAGAIAAAGITFVPSRTAHAQAGAPSSALTFVRDSLYAGLLGTWTGTLTYRDYTTDKQVSLPTTLVITRATDSTLMLAYTYDDGPGKTVRSAETLLVDAASRRWLSLPVASEPEPAARIETVEGFTTGRTGRLVTTARITENDQPAESRNTYVLDASTAVFLHETRTGTAAFRMRNELRVVRAR